MNNKLYHNIPEIIIDKEDIPKSIKVSITIDQDLYYMFQDYCDLHGMKYSTTIALLIRKMMNKNE